MSKVRFKIIQLLMYKIKQLCKNFQQFFVIQDKSDSEPKHNSTTVCNAG